MGRMRIIVILVGLAALSFGASFLVSSLKRSKAPGLAPSQGSAASQQPGMPVATPVEVAALKPSNYLLDELVRELRAKLEACKKREQELDQREKRIQMAQDLLALQAKELENLKAELTAPIAGLKEARDKLEQTRVAISAQEKTNLRSLAATYEKMDPSESGKTFMKMCENSQEEDAARILFYMSEKAKAKVLSEISDKGIVTRLSDKMKRIREEV